ncbi:MAG: serine/threonine-protein kinase [Candidatus Lernaella stagnicola]|nr:serine/threonine-protein kinase [Candidatus Lernaella stagnicola]
MQLGKIGPYRLLKSLGRGGMAEVFVARKVGSLGASQPAVIKRILPHEAKNRDFVIAFIDEARLASRLTHPNIARVLDVGEHEGQPYIAMELVDGVDLERLLDNLAEQSRRLPAPLVAYLGAETLRGLAHTHDLRDESNQPLEVVHRDVSPPNILIDRHGAVKLTDFGIAKARGRLTRTRVGLLKGKPPYLSPEQARGESLDHRSDLFSLGVVLWECLVGRRLFDTGDDLRNLELIREGRIDPPSKHHAEVQSDFERVVLKLLARDPNERYGDAREALDDLEATEAWRLARADELGALVEEVEPEELSRLPLPTTELELTFPLRPARKWPRLAAGIAFLLVAVLVSWAWRTADRPLRLPSAAAFGGNVEGATLILQPERAGTVAFWDGRAIGATPLWREFPLDGKRHELALTAPGYEPLRKSVTFYKTRSFDKRTGQPAWSGLYTVPAEFGEGLTIAGSRWQAGQQIHLPAGRHLGTTSDGRRVWITTRPR